MAGYSSTGTAKKLGVKEGSELVLSGAPDGWAIDDLPPLVTVRHVADHGTFEAATSRSVVIAFFRAVAAYEAEIQRLASSIFPAGALWIAWPRRAAGHQSDISDNTIRASALPIGLVDNKVAAIDEDWSGLRIVWRKTLRESARQNLN